MRRSRGEGTEKSDVKVTVLRTGPDREELIMSRGEVVWTVGIGIHYRGGGLMRYSTED